MFKNLNANFPPNVRPNSTKSTVLTNFEFDLEMGENETFARRKYLNFTITRHRVRINLPEMSIVRIGATAANISTIFALFNCFFVKI
ncbi:hypothetical protein T10_2842 [Trichinella papuae]|uniref:Uncharacterized protein n=1 Tax=Trichinella papuae TaxID=268474 RepID=A0A0V1MA57_9BILA|nr:hypothetical protein T10_2842 [Trichinella papuae]